MSHKNNYPRGSEWNRWELHIHTPETKKQDHFIGSTPDEKWMNYIQSINNYESDVKVIAITDYLCIDNYFKFKQYYKNGVIKKTFDLILPNVELRISPVTDKNNPINIHCIFNPKIDDRLNDKFFAKLKFDYQDVGYSATKNSLIDFGKKHLGSSYKDDNQALIRGIEQYVIPFENLKKVFNEDKELRENTIIVVAGGSKDGVSGLNGHFELLEGEKFNQLDATKQSIYFFCDALFSSNPGDVKYFIGEKRNQTGNIIDDEITIKKKFGKLMPCFHGSDAHWNDKIFEPDDKKYCWIKSNPTFEGLKLALYEPKSRVYIGKEPSIIKKVKENKNKYIDRLELYSINNYDNSKGIWFDNQIIELNKELVTIVGNKGMGKSAITDIIGLCCDTSTYNEFSFLTNKKFLKDNIASNFEAKLFFEAPNDVILKKLNEKVNSNLEERVKYLPQSYFEKLCSSIDSNKEFQEELENVVFSHVNPAVRNNKGSFQSYIEDEKKIISNEVKRYIFELEEINSNISKLQEKGTKRFLENLNSQIELKSKEFKSHWENRPKVPELSNKIETTQEESLKHQQLEVIKNNLNSKIKEQNDKNERVSILNAQLSELSLIKQSIEAEINRINSFRNSLLDKLNTFDLNINIIYPQPIIYTQSIINKINLIENEILKLKIEIGLLPSPPDYSTTYVSLKTIINNLETEYNTLANSLNEKQKKQEEYKKAIEEWRERTLSLVGKSKTIPAPETLRYLENEKRFIENEVEEKINDLKNKRKNITEKIYNEKSKIIDIYTQIKTNIDDALKDKDIEEYNISINVSFLLGNFKNRFLEYIDKSKRGSYKGINESSLKVNSLIEDRDLMSFNSFYTFLDSIIYNLEYNTENNNEKNDDIFNQIKDDYSLEELYNYIFSLEYLEEIYELRFNDKKIDQLSPGERGAVLIVFYLLLDKNDIPLIFDQPEDNLDNQSVFQILVPFIKSAKVKRQLIIVTHNPNLAVVADSEQVIHVSIDKKNNYKFNFISGGIEDPIINQSIVDVLEGTMPAFDKRKLKYN